MENMTQGSLESGNWLDACIEEMTSALASTTDGDPNRVTYLERLASLLKKRSRITGLVYDIKIAIGTITQALTSSSNDPTNLALYYSWESRWRCEQWSGNEIGELARYYFPLLLNFHTYTISH
jgi:hypothetical protein